MEDHRGHYDCLCWLGGCLCPLCPGGLSRQRHSLLPHQEEKSGASSALSQFGGLAAMAGISIPSDSNVEQVVATLNSRKFLRQYIDGKKLLPVLFEEIWDAETQSWLVESVEG